MRIGLLIYGSLETLSGGYLYDRRLVADLRAAGDQVTVISLPWRNYLAHLGDNLRVRLPQGLDVLIQDELNHPSLIAANRRPHPSPVIALVHHLRCSEERPGWRNALYRAVETAYLRSVDGFIFNSRTTRDAVHALVGDSRPYVIAYPPTDRFGRAVTPEEAQQRAHQPGPLRVLFLGNLIPRKGLHTLLRAIQAVNRDAGEAILHLDVIGNPHVDPPYAARLRAMAEQAGLQGSVSFSGALDDRALAKRLRAAQVLAVPSTYEGFGIVYLEGMGFGLPAIGTTAGAAGEIITPEQDGFLVPPGDAMALAECLRALAQDRPRLARLALGALARYERQPAWEQSVASIRTFLQHMSEKTTA